jgi:hypothetical protein
LTAYRQTAREQERLRSLMRLIPKGHQSLIDIGARDGFISKALTAHFERVIALDLHGVIGVSGDVTRLPFRTKTIDCALCTEVLEHIPSHQLTVACAEIMRVSRVAALIGVPFRQDLRAGRTLCASCGHINPPWGHLNSFNEKRLTDLFKPMRAVSIETVWPTREDRTNWASATLMSLAGLPWGTYGQEEPCVKCGQKLVPPGRRPPLRRACGRAAVLLDRVQHKVAKTRPWWLHIRFEYP